MTEVEQLFAKKQELGSERDLCAEMYNVWITKLHEFQTIPEKYNMYMKLIGMLEPYTNTLKEEIREINRQICEIEGVDNIEDTPYTRECVYKYGMDKPKGE